MNMTLIEAENAVIEEFSMYEEWLDKYEYLIELGKSLKDYPETAKTDDKLIKGCQSRVWLDYGIEDGKIIFNADSDAIITKGIILCEPMDLRDVPGSLNSDLIGCKVR